MRRLMIGLILMAASYSARSDMQLEMIEYNRDGSAINSKKLYQVENDSEQKIDISVIDGWAYCIVENMSENEFMKTINGSLVCYAKNSAAVVTHCVSSRKLRNNSSSIGISKVDKKQNAKQKLMSLSITCSWP